MCMHIYTFGTEKKAYKNQIVYECITHHKPQNARQVDTIPKLFTSRNKKHRKWKLISCSNINNENMKIERCKIPNEAIK